MTNLLTVFYKQFSILIFCLFISACSLQSGEKPASINGSTMGTSYNIQFFNNKVNNNRQQLAGEIENILELINDLMSTWRDDSEISRINKMPIGQWIKVSPDTLYVIELARSISQQSEGAFDVTLGPLVDLWGFGAKEDNNVSPDDETIKNAMLLTGYQNLLVDLDKGAIKKRIPLHINLSAIAKGYAVDKLAEHLDSYGYSAYLVEIGGEIRTKGNKIDGTNWRIAIESPTPDVRKAHQVISISGQSIATSGDYRNFIEKDGQRFSHTIDPATGKPVIHNLVSVTVVSDSAARADALATAIMVMGPEQGYIFCEENLVPAYFIYKQDGGFQELYTDSFKSLMMKN